MGIEETVADCVESLKHKLVIEEQRYCGLGGNDNPCKYMLEPKGNVTLYRCANGRNPENKERNLQIEFVWGQQKDLYKKEEL